jgi:hypothetical protein
VAVGDSRGSNNGVNTAILAEIASEIVRQNAEFVVFPGDLVNGYVSQTELQSQLMTWRNTMQPVYDAGIDVYPVRGNHDVGSPAGTAAWDNVFSGPYAMPGNGPVGEENITFSFEHRNVFMIGLDQYVTLRRVNQAWVDDQFEANTKPHVFAFGHEPAFKAQHSDCLDDYPANRNVFWESLEDVGARVYFCGHDHFYDHARIDDGDGDPENDLHQYIIGTAGAPLRSWSPPYDGLNSPYTVHQQYYSNQYGYVVVEIDGAEATLTWWERTSPGVYEAVGDVWSYTAVPEPGISTIVILGMIAIFRFRSNRQNQLR